MPSSLLHVTSTLSPTIPSTNTQRAFKTRTNQTQGFRVSCNTAPHDDHNDNKLILPETQKLIPPNVDRRNVLVGLGGLYTAANLTSMPEAIAAPIEFKDITSKCKKVSTGFTDSDKATRAKECCPPSLGKTTKKFVFPKETTVRRRWPAHAGTPEQVEKYRRAMQAMRDLPDDHPHSFNSQAKIHCAYCHGAYTQPDGDDPSKSIELSIHNSWLFFPFHRWYLYFYERILGKLIDDPTFALPFWKWDDPAGMRIPEIFIPECLNGTSNSLQYGAHRDPAHLPPAIVNLDYTPGIETVNPDKQQIICNLQTVYRELVSNGSDALGFFGGVYRAGDKEIPIDDKTVGSVEAGSHTAVHLWVGDSRQPNREDMGRFYSAGYDPLFYCHHANVDRMWKLWKELRLPGHTEPTHSDWLNASYVFYDENEELVSVNNEQCINLKKLGYNYIENSKEVFPWRKSRPPPRKPSEQVASTDVQLLPTVDKMKFPISLDKILKVRVKRPAVSRTDEDKEKANEILSICGIKFDCRKFVKFDVFVNDKLKNGAVTTTCDPEYAGGFAQIPHSERRRKFMSSGARFGLDEILQGTKTEDEEYATVTLVPRRGCEDLTIGLIKIELVPVKPY